MAPVLAPSFLLTADEDDFDADFDIPEGHNVIANHTTVASATQQHTLDEEDWDKEFNRTPSSIIRGTLSLKSQPSLIGKVTNLKSAKTVSADAELENWDDDDDLDLPPPSNKPLRLSLSPRAKATLDAVNMRNMGQTMQTTQESNEDVSTIKVSRVEFMQKLNSTPTPPSSHRLSAANPTKPPTPQEEDDFEDDFALPSDLAQLSLKTLPTLSHRTSKASLDPWGDHTSSSLYSDAGSSSLSQPSPSSAPSSQPETEDDDDFPTDGDMLDGLQLPDSMSSQDMQRILDGKKRLSRYGGDRVKVAAPAEDDFEIGLEIGDDDDLSPSRLKLNARLVGKGANRGQSAPTAHKPTPSLPVNLSIAVPPQRSRLRKESSTTFADVASGRPSKDGARSPSRKATNPSSGTTSLKSNDAFPTLRRTPASFAGSMRSANNRFPALSGLVPPPLSTNPNVLGTTSSSSHNPPSASSNAPSTRVLSPTSTTSATSPPPRSPTLIVKHQKSYSRLPNHSNYPQPGQSRRLLRKASLSSLDVNFQYCGGSASSHSPSPSPELTLNPARPPLPHANTLSHATSMRDIYRGYDAPTVSSRTRNMLRMQEQAGPSSDREHLKGPPFDRFAVPPTRPSTPVANPVALRLTATTVATTGNRVRSRAPLSNIFPTTTSVAMKDKKKDLPSSPNVRSTSPISRPAPPPKRSSPTSSRTKPSASMSCSESEKVKPLLHAASVRVMRRPKKAKVFGDGTELDAFDDLAVNGNEEDKYRVTPSGSGNIRGGTRSGTIGRSSSTSVATTSNSGTIGRRGTVTLRSASTVTGTASLRRPSNASSQGGMDLPQQAPTLRRKQRFDIVPLASSLFPSNLLNSKTPVHTPPTSKTTTPPTSSSRKKRDPTTSSAGKRKPTLIRNLGGVGSPKVVGDMRWNPQSLRWEGNDSVLKDFEVSSSTRPALITHLTGSSVGALGSPGALANSSFSALASGARVVGDMVFDPIRMCWLSKSGEEEDPFAGMDDEDGADKGKGSALADDDDEWDEEGKGGTIRAVLGNINIPSRRGSGISSGTSSLEGSPARSSHGRSASESDGESMTGSGSIGGGRGSSLGGLLASIDEGPAGEEARIPIAPALLEACRAAEERHRIEMRGWNLATGSYSTLSRRAPPIPPPEPTFERGHLHDIRALATRRYRS